ncbi:MAG TPA: cyclic nucleotide-binding domain-containing protein [Caldithrix abyssi]|uniref:Cyclic nucleotide-binding domain-containing protein n=1 Tax=Caldithrix abyssi TaxID=187145 RepID=A0A7V5RNZ0_CALAY|nr:cyclic nucleotide-binding domain-containing protein [Caldithrix abyssi]
MIQIGKILKKVPIFKMLGKESIDFIVERLKFKTFEKGENICEIGDPGEEMFIIISGETDICIGEKGNQQVVATLKSGDYFGEMALLTGEPRSATVKANEKTETFVLYKNDFDVILEKYPSISLSMGKIVSQRLRDTLKKAASASGQKKDNFEARSDGSGPSGSLKDMALVDLISFCEANSLTGDMKIKHDNELGVFEFERGELLSIKLGDLSDDAALDKMINWQDGSFEINVRPLTLKTTSDDSTEDEIKKVLIVNNSRVVRRVIERAFSGLGYEVSTASNIAGSLDVINTVVPDIIISDIKLADGSGPEFVKQVRDTQNVPFIFITDDAVKADLEAELKDVPDVDITKTHEVSEIVKLVENKLLQ